MLINNYSEYVWIIFLSGLQSPVGIAGITLIVIALAAQLLPAIIKASLRRPVLWMLWLSGFFCLITSFYNGVYIFNEDPESLIAEFSLNMTVCDTAKTSWLKAGYGFANPCINEGCRKRGLTLRKEMRMTGFPPWPEYRTEFQCLVR